MEKLLVIEVTGEIKMGGQPSDFGPKKTRQVAYLHGLSAYPDKWTMGYSHLEKPIEPGFYLLAAGSFVIGKYGPEIKNPVFVTLDDAAKQINERLTQARAAKAA